MDYQEQQVRLRSYALISVTVILLFVVFGALRCQRLQHAIPIHWLRWRA